MPANSVALLRERINHEVFDYQVLLDALSNYRKPRDKVTRLLKAGMIVRIKKGLYCFSEAFRREPIAREYLANLIYGPSYISLEYALSHYGLIPERVESVTSVTTRRSRGFETPLGSFSYRHLSGRRYSVGALLESSGKQTFLMASPEKALVDKVWTDKRLDGRRLSDFEAYLFSDLRMDREAVKAMDHMQFRRIASALQSPKVHHLVRFLIGGNRLA
jgi:hypothetical protein